jgi:hypothetical protein
MCVRGKAREDRSQGEGWERKCGNGAGPATTRFYTEGWDAEDIREARTSTAVEEVSDDRVNEGDCVAIGDPQQ